MGLEQIEENEAHLWYLQPEGISDPGLLRRYGEALTVDEREKAGRYYFAKDRHVGLVTWGMVRCLLSRYVAEDPSDWRFCRNRYGRPEIAKPSVAGPLRFNISHTEGMIVVLISKDREVGVDVECRPYLGPCLEIADRFFSPSEVDTLRSLPSSERALRFIEYWTLKESYIKARGMGLAMPLDEFSFCIQKRSKDKVDIRFDTSLEEDPARWRFSLDTIGKKHIVATAIERRGGERLLLLRREIDPAVH